MRLAASLPSTVLVLVLAGCDPYAPYRLAVERDFKPRTCEPGSSLPWERRTVRGIEVVALCGQDTEHAREVLKRAGMVASSIQGFLPGPGGSDDDEGRAFIRYNVFRKQKPGDSTWERLPYDAITVWDRKLEARLIGLIPERAPEWAKKGWAKDGADYYSRLGGHLLEAYEEKDHHRVVGSLVSDLVDRSRRHLYPAPAWERFSPETCAAARFDARSGYPDPIDEDTRRYIVESVFGKEESDESRALRKLLDDPEARCGPAYDEQVKAGLAMVQRRKEKSDAEQARLAALEAQRQRERLDELRRQREARTMVEEGRLREQAESLALAGRPFAALAVLGWMTVLHAGEPALFTVPSRRVALRGGLSDADLSDALRGQIAERYFATVEYPRDGGASATFPRAARERPPHTVKVVIAAPPRVPVVVEKEKKRRSWTTEGPEMVDKEAQRRSSARLESLSREARPLAERVEAIDARLARIEERLAGPRLEIRAGAKEGEVSRMERVCEPVPGGPPKCTNKWVTFSREGPMRSNGGLAPWEADDLKAERRKLADERESLVARLKALGQQAQAQGSAPVPRQRTREFHSEEYDVFRYHAEGQVAVQVTVDGKRWPELSVPYSFEMSTERTPYIVEKVEERARLHVIQTARAGFESRWEQVMGEKLDEQLHRLGPDDLRERERQLGRSYLASDSSRQFLESSIDELKRSGVSLDCWSDRARCFLIYDQGR